MIIVIVSPSGKSTSIFVWVVGEISNQSAKFENSSSYGFCDPDIFMTQEKEEKDLTSTPLSTLN